MANYLRPGFILRWSGNVSGTCPECGTKCNA
jgi:hypothetical protein